MRRYTFLYSFLILLLILNVFCESDASFNDIFAGKKTPVWFLETNPKDLEQPFLREIPNALENAKLINNYMNTKDELLYHNNEELYKNTFYVETIVVIDYTLYKKIGENIDDALNYVVSFFNSVDLRYRLIQTPKIFLNIAGIILAKDQTALYYVNQSKDKRGSVIANKVLFNGGKFFLYKKKIGNHDIVVTLTAEDICSMNEINVCYSMTIGQSLLGKACHSHLNTAIVEDNGAFSGVIPTAHEIAHLLSVPHDGVGQASDCSSGKGYIMTESTSTTENNFKWSKCSENILKKLINSPISECLKNKPNPGTPVTRILPGKVLSANQQCEKRAYGVPCLNGKRICNALSCFNMNLRECVVDGPAAEGTVCGENMYCSDGKCIPEIVY